MVRAIPLLLVFALSSPALAQFPVWPRVERLPDDGAAPDVGNSGVTPPLQPNLGPQPNRPVSPRAAEPPPQLGPTVTPRGPAPPRDPWVRRPLPPLELAEPWPQDMRVTTLPVPPEANAARSGQLRLP